MICITIQIHFHFAKSFVNSISDFNKRFFKNPFVLWQKKLKWRKLLTEMLKYELHNINGRSDFLKMR